MKVLKYTTFGLLAVVVAIVVMLFVGIPANFIVGPLQSEIEAETGYRLSIAGSSRLRLLPSPRIEIENISLTDTRNGNSQTGATAESVRLAAPLMGLFGDRPEITEVVVTRPVIRTPLYRQRTAASAPSARATPAKKRALPPITVDHFAIHDGTVNFINTRGVIESRLEKIELIGALTGDDRIEVIGSARSGDQNIALNIKGKVPQAGFDGSPLPIDFSFELPGLLHGPVTGSAEVRPSGSLIRINSINGAIGPNKFSGWASVDVADKPLVHVDLDFQKLDIGALRDPGTGSGKPGTPIDQPWSTAPLNLDSVNFFDAQVQISAAALNIETFHFAPITISATVSNGIVQIAFPQMGLYGGQASGGFAANLSTDQYSYAVRLDINNVRALPLLTDIVSFTTIDGRMQARIDLRAWGRNERAIMSSIEGTTDLLFQDGQIRTVNLAQMIRNVGATILNGWQAGVTEKTDFSQFSASFQFDKGLATTTNLQLVGPLVRITGVGTADIGAKTLNFRLDPKLVLSLQGQGATAENPVGFGVPVAVQGTWGQPKIYPEVAGMLENPDAAFAKLKELGLGLFGSATGGQPGGASPQSGAGTILQGIGDVLKNLGNNPGSSPQPAPTQPARPRR